MNEGVDSWRVHTRAPTPIVRFELPELHLLAKLEYFQRGESVKARIGRALIDQLIRDGALGASTRFVVEAGAGNTALALWYALKELGHPATVVSVVSEKVGPSAVTRLRALGIEVRVVPYEVASDPAAPLSPLLRFTQEVAAQFGNAVLASQFFSRANPDAHERTTGPEIVAQLHDPPDAIVLGVGTGGTLTGVGRAFRGVGWPTSIVLADPQGSVIGAAWRGVGAKPGKSIVSGIGGDFVPPVLDLSLIDEVVTVEDRETCAAWHRLRLLGFCVGSSSACAVAAAQKWSSRYSGARTCLVLFADHGRHYNLPMPEDVQPASVSMTEEKTTAGLGFRARRGDFVDEGYSREGGKLWI